MARQLRPVLYAKEEELDALRAEFAEFAEEIRQHHEDFARAQAIFEQALLNVLHEHEAATDALVEAGILTDEDDAEVEGMSPESAPPFEVEAGASADGPYIEARGDLLKEEWDSDDDDGTSDGEGMPEVESEEAKAERLAAIRARRAKVIDEQGLRRQAEEANESDPALADRDPNAITDVPEEGVTVDAGRDPFTGDPRD